MKNAKLQQYLAQIDQDAQEMFDLLVCQFNEQEDVTEQLKAENQMEWVRRMNSIRSRATGIVNHELIYV
ncbi:MAG: TnpV protein [Clostridia bacterium]|nr:TnpV protein [Clostridia bacterium]